jgi:hypothetical protein
MTSPGHCLLQINRISPKVAGEIRTAISLGRNWLAWLPLDILPAGMRGEIEN